MIAKAVRAVLVEALGVIVFTLALVLFVLAYIYKIVKEGE